jgi:hypothetical protein
MFPPQNEHFSNFPTNDPLEAGPEAAAAAAAVSLAIK